MLRFLRVLSLGIPLAAFESGCTQRHVAAPVSPTPMRVPPQTTAPDSAAAPTVTPPVPAQNPTQQDDANQKNRPPQPQTPPSPTPPPAVSPPRRTTARPGEPNGPAQTNPAPRLGDILTPDQERQFNAAIDQSLARTQSSLEAIGNHKLTKEQQSVLAQVQGFVRQAQTTRKSNLAAARSLAERADVLARDLAGSLR